MRVCFVHPGDGGLSASNRWFLGPAATFGWPTCTFSDAHAGNEPDADVYVVEREIWRAPLERWQARRKRVLCWFDDGYEHMPYLSSIATLWDKAADSFRLLLRRIDGVVTPSATLTADFAEGCKAAYYIPNYHTAEEVVEKRRSAVGEPVVVGWGGTHNHWTSWRDTRLYLAIPAEYQVHLVGDMYIASTITGQERVESIDTLPYADYLTEVASWDVALIPVHGEYDRRRSWCKALECCLAGTPWIAIGNATSIYRGVPGGVCIPHAGLLQETVEHILADPPLSAEAMRAWAAQQHVRLHQDEWEEVLR